MTEFLSNRNAEIARWRDVITSYNSPNPADYEQEIQQRHRDNHTLPLNNFKVYFLAGLPRFQGKMNYMGYDWRNGSQFPGTFNELVAPYLEAYQQENTKRWEYIQQVALRNHEHNTDPQKIIETPQNEKDSARDAADIALTDAFLDLASRLGAESLNPLELLR
jgi:hypothetical protein